MQAEHDIPGNTVVFCVVLTVSPHGEGQVTDYNNSKATEGARVVARKHIDGERDDSIVSDASH